GGAVGPVVVQAEGAGPVELLANALGVGLENDGVIVRQVVQKVRVRAAKRELHRSPLACRHALDVREQVGGRAFGAQALEGPYDVVQRQFASIVEGDALGDGEGVGQAVVADRPVSCQPGNKLCAGVCVQQIIVHSVEKGDLGVR